MDHAELATGSGSRSSRWSGSCASRTSTSPPRRRRPSPRSSAGGPLTVGELAKAEHVSSPMITKIAKGLEEEGLVTRTVDPTDKRVTQMAITTEGERRLERSRSRKNAWLAKQFAP